MFSWQALSGFLFSHSHENIHYNIRQWYSICWHSQSSQTTRKFDYNNLDKHMLEILSSTPAWRIIAGSLKKAFDWLESLDPHSFWACANCSGWDRMNKRRNKHSTVLFLDYSTLLPSSSSSMHSYSWTRMLTVKVDSVVPSTVSADIYQEARISWLSILSSSLLKVRTFYSIWYGVQLRKWAVSRNNNPWHV